MLFKRSTLKYGDTPEPVTPYQKAAQAWDNRIGSARLQARNWRLMAFGCLSLVMALSLALIWQSLQSRITPYVVEVDKLGAVQAIGPAVAGNKPSDVQISYHLAKFIKQVRAISVDPVVVREQWLQAYNYVTDRGARTLNDYARNNDPFLEIGQRSVSVEITSVVRASDDSFQIKWFERHFRNGAFQKLERHTAILTIILQKPANVTLLRKNPLGIYVHGLNWSRDLDNGDRK